MALNLSKKTIEFLEKNPEKRFTAREIAQWIFTTYPDECRMKQQRSKAKVTPLTDDLSLLQQLVAEIGAHRIHLQKQYPQIKTTEERPRKYYYTNESDEAEIKNAEIEETPLKKTGVETVLKGEHVYYPKLAEYLFSQLNVYSKRIDEKRSSNTRGPNGNRWLYPDIVGMEDLSEDWNREIKDCVKEYSDKKTKLWSFEVKVLINRSNVREVFFQAVSNSSWANFGYLVAGEFSGNDTLKELRMLSSLHGIGIIRLDVEDPSESEILIPAKEKTEIDWNIANRLADENPDFLSYIKNVRQFYQTGDIHKHNWS